MSKQQASNQRIVPFSRDKSLRAGPFVRGYNINGWPSTQLCIYILFNFQGEQPAHQCSFELLLAERKAKKQLKNFCDKKLAFLCCCPFPLSFDAGGRVPAPPPISIA